MNQLSDPFTSDQELDELANRFFRQFSRTEYALKAAGYLMSPNGRAAPNWDDFANDVGGKFWEVADASAEVQAAIDYINAEPPRQQVAVDSQLMWEDVAPSPGRNLNLLLGHVRRMRNNLFHGGKFGRLWLDRDRSLALLPRGLIVLDACVKASPKLRKIYEI